MPELGAFRESRTLYRGQARRYDAVRASGWRTPYADADALAEIRHHLEDFLHGHTDVVAFEKALRAVHLDDPPRASCARWIRDDAGAGILAHLAAHVRNTVSPAARRRIGMAVFAEVEDSYLARYQSFMFNRKRDPFFAASEKTLFELADVVLEFFDQHRDRFDVDFRIFQVVRDLSGVLQHYGVLGTPGLDLTDDLDIALWFASHQLKLDPHDKPLCYELLPPEEWGVVYTVEIPTVQFSPVPCGTQIELLPGFFATDLGGISPLFTRIRRQHGWYAAPALSWEHGFDFALGAPIRGLPAEDYGSQREIVDRLSARGLTQEFLFPDADHDPFKAHLRRAGIETFL